MRNRMTQDNKYNHSGHLLIGAAILLLLCLLLAGLACGEGQQGGYNRDAFRNLGEMYKENQETGTWSCNGRAVIPTGEENQEITVCLNIYGSLDGTSVSTPRLYVGYYKERSGYTELRNVGVSQFAIATDNETYSFGKYGDGREDDITIHLGQKGILLLQSLTETGTVTIRVKPGLFNDPVQTFDVDMSLLDAEIIPLCQAILNSNCQSYMDFSRADEFESYQQMQYLNIPAYVTKLKESDESPAKLFADQEGFTIEPFDATWIFQRVYTEPADGYRIFFICEMTGSERQIQGYQMKIRVEDEGGNVVRPVSIILTADDTKYNITYEDYYREEEIYIPVFKKTGKQLLKALAEGKEFSIRFRLENAKKISIDSVDSKAFSAIQDFANRALLLNPTDYMSKDTQEKINMRSGGCKIDIE